MSQGERANQPESEDADTGLATEEDETPDPQPQAAATSRKDRIKATKKRLSPAWFMQGQPLTGPLDVAVEGEGISDVAAQLPAFGLALQRVGALYESLVGQPPWTRGYVFGSSVVIKLEPSEDEARRVQDASATLKNLISEGPSELTIDDIKIILDTNGTESSATRRSCANCFRALSRPLSGQYPMSM